MEYNTKRVRAATDELVKMQGESRLEAEKAIVAITGRLRAAVEPQSLRLPNLGTSRSSWRGVRVGTKNPAEPLPLPRGDRTGDGREVLCIDRFGHLVFARLRADMSLVERSLRFDEIRAEWAEDVAEAVCAAIDYHLEGCDRAMVRYADLARLSQRLQAALTEED